MQVVINELMTTYEKAGKGPVVLFLHGWGDSHKTYDELSKALTDRYTTIALDLPGFGGSQPPPADWGLNDYGDFVAAFLQKINVQPFAVIGHSNGGAIAVRALATHKIQTQKLVLLASAGIRDTYKGRKKVLRIAAKTAKVATYPLPKRLQNKLKRKAYTAIGSELFVAEHMQGTFKKVVTDDVQADAKVITMSALLVYGEDDTATPPTYGALFHRYMQGSSLEVLPGAGHFVHHDKPAEVSKLVQDFLA
jgi:pimeloyl-ACP methyl ester carboxylesterase